MKPKDFEIDGVVYESMEGETCEGCAFMSRDGYCKANSGIGFVPRCFDDSFDVIFVEKQQ